MLCRICSKKVRTKRNLMNIYDAEIHHICEKCYEKHPLLPRFSVIPIEGYVMHYHVMSTRFTNLDVMAFMSFYQRYIILYLQQYRDHVLLLFDIVDSEILTMLDSLKLGNLMVVTLYENI